MAEFGGSEGGGLEFMMCDEKEVESPEEIEEAIKSTLTVRWDPFTVLPKEIYVKIFNKLDNPTDKQNFMNAHVKWYELFKAERVKFLFGKVFEDLSLLPENTWREDDQSTFGNPFEDEDSSDGMVSDNDEENAASFNERLSKAEKSLNRLRLVCRDWDQSIQDYYQLHPDYFQFVYCEDKDSQAPLWSNESKQLKNQYPNGYLIEALNRSFPCAARILGTDLDEFQASHPPSKNPFLTRKVRIQLNRKRPSSYDVEQLRTLLSQLLETYGRHVWHFSFRDLSSLTRETYLEITNWLHLMPELRTLQIEYANYNRDSEGLRETSEFINTIQIVLPRMKKLQSFHVFGFPNSALNKLLKGMKTVEKVEVTDPPHPLEGLNFPTTLTEAAFKLRSDEGILLLNSIEQFPVVHNLVMNLLCTLEMTHFEDSQPSWKTIWIAIEEKFPAVEDLHLTLPRTSSEWDRYKLMEQSLDCRLKLKKLKRLSITTIITFCLDFLQEIKTLRELKIQLDLSYLTIFNDLVGRERIQFNRDSTTMWESNIWQVFPNLRKLSVRDPGVRGEGEIQHLYEKGAKGQQTYKKIIIEEPSFR